MKRRERRREPRFMCADLVKVRIDEAGGVREEVANLEDISPSGACVQIAAEARAGADIEIVCARCRLKGKVCYCRFVEIGYDIGVAFDRPGAWDRRRYTPKHLLQLTECPTNNSTDFET